MSENATKEDIHRVELLIADMKGSTLEAFHKHREEIEKYCNENVKELMSNCPSKKVFGKDENVIEYYNTKRTVEEHINQHKVNNEKFNKLGIFTLTGVIGLAIKEFWGYIKG